MSDATVFPDAAERRSPLLSRRMGLLLAVIAIAVLPLIFNDTYWRTNLTICAINVLLALGLDFILGYTGQLNLGHSAFYGLGAYVSTLLIVKLGVPFWAAFVAGVVFSGIAGMFLLQCACEGITSRSRLSDLPSSSIRSCSTGSA
jgi:ABC-type branched-subunit amino acid transport system permease subunit